jgi:hypothetical protein
MSVSSSVRLRNATGFGVAGFNRALLALIVGIGCLVGEGRAAESPVRISWYCWLAGDSQNIVQCVSDTDAGFVEASLGLSAEITDGQLLQRDLFARGASPNLTRLVRTNPSAYGDRIWTIPLLGPALEMEHVQRLARAIMCGAEPVCSVRLGRFSPASMAFDERAN